MFFVLMDGHKLAREGVEALEWDLFIYVVDGVGNDYLAWINLQYYLISYNSF